MCIRVEFPEELLVASREEPQVFTRKVMIHTLGHLYEQSKISSGIGAQVLGCERKSSGFGEAQDDLREGQAATARGKGKLTKLSLLSEDVLAAAFASQEEYHV